MASPFSLFWAHLNRVLSQRNSKLFSARRRPFGSQTLIPGIAGDVEQLEKRALLSAASVASSVVSEPTIQVDKTAATAPASGGYSPSQLQTAYGFNLVGLSSANGTGQTIAIVDAYNDPTIQTDLQAFDNAYGLANPPSLTVVGQTGSTSSLPSVDPTQPKADDWEVEESLDVEWAHALAPGANIILVEANSASNSDLMAAVKTAADLPGVSVVSMSWGGSEFSTESSYDSYFTTPAGHQGVTFVASTGDDGEPGGYPAFSPNVLAVGGTSLTLGASGNYLSESAWSDSGGGISQYESQPSYQQGVVTQTTTKRAIPDVAFDADPNTGVAVYDSYSFGTSNPWAEVGGTSLSAPSWASIISIVNQGRAQNGLGTLNGPTTTATLPALYSLDKTDPSAFHDITTGGNNADSAGAGYDLVTGLGSPVVNNLVAALDGTSTSPPPTSTSKLVFEQSPTIGTAGQALSPTVTVAIENQSGQVITTNDSTVTLTITSGPGGFASGSTVSVAAVNGIATFNKLILDTAGTYTLSASGASLTSGMSQTLTVSAAQAAKVVFQKQPSTGTAGQTLSSITAVVEDQFGNIVTGNNSTVTIAVASGPGSFSSTSTTSVAAVKGVATFNNLVLATPGTYMLSVSDSGLTGTSSLSFTLSSVTTPTPPTGLSAPKNVSAVALTSTSILLSWTDVSGATGYRIYQVSGSQSTLLGTLGSTSSSVEITGATAGTTYSFKVEAYNATSTADASVVSVTLPSTSTLSAPALVGMELSSTSIELMWTSISGAQGYRVYYSIGGSQRVLLGTLSSKSTSVSISGLVAGTTYEFQVEAYSGSTVADSNWVIVSSAAAAQPRVASAVESADAAGLPSGFAADFNGSLRRF